MQWKKSIEAPSDYMKSEDETAKWITNHKLSRADFTIHELKLNICNAKFCIK